MSARSVSHMSLSRAGWRDWGGRADRGRAAHELYVLCIYVNRNTGTPTRTTVGRRATYRRAKFRIRSRVPCKLKRVANAGDERRSPARRGRVQRYSRRMSRRHRERHALAAEPAVEVRRARHGRDSTRCACGKAAHYTLVSTAFQLSVLFLRSSVRRPAPLVSKLAPP